jgi:hypothetical protein
LREKQKRWQQMLALERRELTVAWRDGHRRSRDRFHG